MLNVLAGLAALTVLGGMGGCARPEVDIPREAGAGGAFCITPDDCGGGLGCHERRCCGNPSCGTQCAGLLEQTGTALNEATHHSREERRSFKGVCVSLCCGGVPLPEIERALSTSVGPQAHM